MPSINKSKSAILVKNVQEYVQNLEKRRSYTYRITPKGEIVYIKGEEILTLEDLNKKYPIVLEKNREKGQLIDIRKKMLYD